MRFYEAFKEAMHRFDLKGVDLSQKSGLNPSQISQFRGDQNIRIETLEKILFAMPQEAREYMLSLVSPNDTEAEQLPPKSEDGE
ncbi:MAG: helix-turn-helix domain-containing protein [Nodosilinea sp.]